MTQQSNLPSRHKGQVSTVDARCNVRQGNKNYVRAAGGIVSTKCCHRIEMAGHRRADKSDSRFDTFFPNISGQCHLLLARNALLVMIGSLFRSASFVQEGTRMPHVLEGAERLPRGVREPLRNSYKPRRCSLGVTPRNCLKTRVMWE